MLQERLCRATPCPVNLQSCEVHALLLKATQAGYCSGESSFLQHRCVLLILRLDSQQRLPLAGCSVETEDTGLHR